MISGGSRDAVVSDSVSSSNGSGVETSKVQSFEKEGLLHKTG